MHYSLLTLLALGVMVSSLAAPVYRDTAEPRDLAFHRDSLALKPSWKRSEQVAAESDEPVPGDDWKRSEQIAAESDEAIPADDW